MIIHYDQQKNLHQKDIHQDVNPACAFVVVAKRFFAYGCTILVGRRILEFHEHDVVLFKYSVVHISGIYWLSASCPSSHLLLLGSRHKSAYSSLLLLAISSIFKDLFICCVHRLGICCPLPAWASLSSISYLMDGFLARPALSAEIHSPPQGLSLNRTLSAYLLFARSGQYLALALIFSFLHNAPKGHSPTQLGKPNGGGLR
jgi:hypothetical protein